MAHRTLFAGLAAPDPGESTQVLNGDFIFRNPDLIDQFLRIGALTHRHDGHAPLPNPQTPVSLSGSTTGGSLDGGSYFLTYTVTDQNGGETLAAPAAMISLPEGVLSPVNGPSAAVSSAGGIMPDGNYAYAYTFTDGAGGETTLSPTTWAYIDPGFASAQIQLSGLTPTGGAVNWRLWRSYEGEDWHLVSQGSGDTYLDTGFNPPDDPARPPDANTTGGTNTINLTLPSASEEPAIASGVRINIYLGLDPAMPSPALHATLPVACAGTTFSITDDIVFGGAPPPVSTSIPGAARIYAPTEIIGWQTLVASASGATLGSASASAPGKLTFVGSGGATVVVRDAGGGSAVITVTSRAPQPIPGIGVGPPGGPPTTDPLSYLGFTGTGVTVTDQGGGSATVSVTGGGGGGGSFKASGGTGSASITGFLGFAASGNASLQVQDLGGGSAVVLISASGATSGTGSAQSLNIAYAQTSSGNVVVGTSNTDILTLPQIPAGTKGPVWLDFQVPAVQISTTTSYGQFEIVDDLGTVVMAKITPVNNVTAGWFAGSFNMRAKVENPGGRTYKVRATTQQGGGTVTLEPWAATNGPLQPIYFAAVGTYVGSAGTSTSTGFSLGSAGVGASGSAAATSSFSGGLVVVGPGLGSGYTRAEGNVAVLQLDPIPPLYKDGFDNPNTLSAGENTPLKTTLGSFSIAGSVLAGGGGDSRLVVNLANLGRKPVRDSVVQVKFVCSTIASIDIAITFGESNNFAQLNAGVLTVKNFSGGTNVLASVSGVSLSSNTPYWLRAELDQGVTITEIWAKDPATRAPGDAPLYVAQGGVGNHPIAYGRPGVRINEAFTVMDDLIVWSLPEAIE